MEIDVLKSLALSQEQITKENTSLLTIFSNQHGLCKQETI